MSSAREWVQLIDARGVPCGATSRARMRKLRLWHLTSQVFVRNTAGLLCVQTRTLSKDVFPGAYDLAAGGVVAAGETVACGARREVAEELGIKGVPLTFCFEQVYKDAAICARAGVFLTTYDGPLTLQQSEVAAVEWLEPREALALKPVTPDSLAALQRLIEQGWL
ncbi:NUDIX hydrolase [Carnimonas bestiolae]|uniref:NUDIX hydrolase n=1 Tax=Carnimonas bestiolae TaxID=3402172 RepID=UPI003EDB88F1